ncbi:hypothetical protein SAMN04515617_114114 [Collimonas sp. OK242]|uniref:DUF535 family protein n=1 Tax=Collimonas sp. OK242 TaxID=1798195 RepID=UPI00089AD99D|nr:DUF535 family protein [Collimonas sp. OK242]SDY44143.1 hypothetical protein SAMN04515617_114114 [Collimonas sp. OK242]
MISISKLPFKFFIANTSRITRNILMRGSMLKLKTWHRGLLLILNIRQHLKFIRILSHQQTRQLIVSKPELTYKYLRNYISFSIPARTGLLILISHYSYLQNHFKIDFLERISHSPVLLWGQYIDGVLFEIVMAFPHTVDHEGDLCLIFKSDMVSIYRVIFVIADGSLFELPDDHVMCVSSVQGINGFQGIQQATKICHEIQPAQLLMAAMNGVGLALGFKTMVGIASKSQISQNEKFYFSYDEFFGKYGDPVPRKNFYKIQLPYIESPLDSIKTRHRKRTQKKRAFKNEIRDKVACSVEQYLVRQAIHCSIPNT